MDFSPGRKNTATRGKPPSPNYTELCFIVKDRRIQPHFSKSGAGQGHSNKAARRATTNTETLPRKVLEDPLDDLQSRVRPLPGEQHPAAAVAQGQINVRIGALLDHPIHDAGDGRVEGRRGPLMDRAGQDAARLAQGELQGAPVEAQVVDRRAVVGGKEMHLARHVQVCDKADEESAEPGNFRDREHERSVAVREGVALRPDPRLRERPAPILFDVARALVEGEGRALEKDVTVNGVADRDNAVLAFHARHEGERPHDAGFPD